MRKVWLVAVLIILAVLVCSTSACLAQWYKGIIHCHSTYSDGSVSLDEIWQEGSRLGLDFIFMTDHVDCFGEDVDHSIGANFIFPEFHSPVAHRHPNPNYYDTYVYHCQELSPKGRPLIIPGIEFPCSDYKLSRHMLLLGLDQEGDPHAGLSVPAKYWYLPYRPLDEIPVLQILWDQFRLDESKQPIAVVIAHPSLWNPPFDFPSYKTIDSPEADGPLFSPIDAIEFFHPSPRAKEEIQLALYQQFLRWRPDIFLPGVAVTCGNDMHYTEVGLKHNYTFIQADGIDRNDLINGILSGKSYASAWSGKVENISFPTPAGFYPLGDEEYEIYTDQQPIKISFGIVWPNPLLADKEIKLLLDGVELPGSSQRHIIVPLTTNTLSYQFRLPELSQGLHTLCIYSPGQVMGPQFQFVILDRPPIPTPSPPPPPWIKIVIGANDPYEYDKGTFPTDRPRYPTDVFNMTECIYAYVCASLPSGNHHYELRWYIPGGEYWFSQKREIPGGSFRWVDWNKIYGILYPPGQYTLRAYVDGQLLATRTFQRKW